MNMHGNLALAVKTRQPQLARGVIARPRLEAEHASVLARPLTLVTAPPGYGKTHVGLSWCHRLAADGARVAWMRLGEEDDDVERFIGVLTVALRRACMPDEGAGQTWTPAELSIPIDRRIEWLLELVARQTQDVVLFIDDAHALQDSQTLQTLATLLRFAPEQLHLVLLGRAEPALPLASLRAQDAVLELQADSLRFDLAETEQLLRKSRSGEVGADEAAELQAYTGGWIAALRAAMLAPRLPSQALQVAARRPALKSVQALFGELLQQLPPELQVFIEQACLTDRVCPALAAHLSDRADAAALLDSLERQQLFVSARDDDGWIEFHPLFREFMQRRAEARDPARQSARHRSAAAWFAGQAMWAPAIEHALAGGDTAKALAWIEQHAMALVGDGDLLTLLAWERQLRAHLVQSPRRLRLAFAWGLSLCMACDRALALLDGVEAELDTEATAATGAAAHTLLRDECLALRAVLVATTGDYELGAELAARCGGAGRQPPWVANAVRNVLAAAHLHAGRWRQLYGAAPLVGPAGAGADGLRPGDPMSIDYRLSIQGLAEYRQGHLEEAAMRLEEALALGVARGASGRVLAALPVPTLALVRYEQDRLAEAAQLNAAYFDINRRVAPIEGLYGAYLVASRMARLDGQGVRARLLLDEGESIAEARGWRRAVVVLRLERLRHCLLDGRLAEAGAGADSIAGLAVPGPGRPAAECRDFAQAARVASGWYALADGQPARAVEALCPARDQAAASGRRLEQIALGTSLALAHAALGDRPAALRELAEAGRSALALGALRSMVDQPVPLGGLLRLWTAGRPGVAQDEALDGLVQRLRDAAGEGVGRRAASTLIETLSPRELHILQLVAEGQSNKEIARGLGIAPETVKTHVSKVFGKLGASNRAQAAAMVANG